MNILNVVYFNDADLKAIVPVYGEDIGEVEKRAVEILIQMATEEFNLTEEEIQEIKENKCFDLDGHGETTIQIVESTDIVQA